jgi:hypothetical protein
MGVLLNGRLHTLKAMVGKREAKTVQGGDASPRLVGSVLSNIKKNSPLYGVITGVLVKKDYSRQKRRARVCGRCNPVRQSATGGERQ